MSEQDDLLNRFIRSQTELSEEVRGWGGDPEQCEVDLNTQRVRWAGDGGGASAPARVILSWSHSNDSVMMSWANTTIPEASRIEPIDGVQPTAPVEDKDAARRIAVRAWLATGADYVLEVPGVQTTKYLAVGYVEEIDEDEPQSPEELREEVLQVLDELDAALAAAAGVDQAIQGLGAQFTLRGVLGAGTVAIPDGPELADLGIGLSTIGQDLKQAIADPVGTARGELARLRSEWQIASD